MVCNRVSASTGWAMITVGKQRHHTTFQCPSSVIEADGQNDQPRVPTVIHGRTRTWTQDLLYYTIACFLSPQVVCSRRGDGLCFTPSPQNVACLADSEPRMPAPTCYCLSHHSPEPRTLTSYYGSQLQTPPTEMLAFKTEPQGIITSKYS